MTLKELISGLIDKINYDASYMTEKDCESLFMFDEPVKFICYLDTGISDGSFFVPNNMTWAQLLNSPSNRYGYYTEGDYIQKTSTMCLYGNNSTSLPTELVSLDDRVNKYTHYVFRPMS